MTPFTRKAVPSLTACLSVFLLDAKSRRLSPQSILFYEKQLSYFLRWLEENGAAPDSLAITELDRNDIRHYLSDRAESGIAAASVDACYRALNAFCNFCVAEEWVPISPMNNIRRPRKDQKIPPAFSKDEIEQLLRTCAYSRDRAIVLFLTDTGCRAQEMLDLNIEDVNLTTGSVNILRGKGAKQRYAYIGFRTRKLLSLYLAERGEAQPHDPLFTTEEASRLQYDGLKSLMQRLEKASGIECYAHKFRHTMARFCLRAGMNIYALQALMGHTSLEILKVYARVEGVDVAAAHQQYGAVDSM